MDETPVEVAVYRRSLAVGVARVWENVLDWEHLPWLHRESFRSIALESAGHWGWRAEVALQGTDTPIGLELLVDRGASRYVTRTLTGPGAGSEIWTTVRPAGEAQTDVEVRFQLPVPEAQREAVGAAYVGLYTRLWDEDEGMMRERATLLRARQERGDETSSALALGNLAELRERLPCRVEFQGRPVHVVSHAGGLVAYEARCPHWLGPLDPAPGADGCVACPWHGYRFDLATGRGQGPAEALRLRRIPLVIDAADEVTLGTSRHPPEG